MTPDHKCFLEIRFLSSLSIDNQSGRWRSAQHRFLWAAISTGRCNTLCELLCWRLILQVLRGRSLSCLAIALSFAWEWSDKSVQHFRFYETSGLCPYIERGADSKRLFSKTDADWLQLLASLRATGMPMDEMRSRSCMLLVMPQSASARSRKWHTNRGLRVDKRSWIAATQSSTKSCKNTMR